MLSTSGAVCLDDGLLSLLLLLLHGSGPSLNTPFPQARQRGCRRTMLRWILRSGLRQPPRSPLKRSEL